MGSKFRIEIVSSLASIFMFGHLIPRQIPEAVPRTNVQIVKIPHIAVWSPYIYGEPGLCNGFLSRLGCQDTQGQIYNLLAWNTFLVLTRPSIIVTMQFSLIFLLS